MDAPTTRRYTVDPITRLEGHGKIEVCLNEQGEVDRAYLQVPELRGFEVFAIGRPAEEMPQITSRICGVCPMAHHMAASKALDDLYQTEAPSAGKKVRELIYDLFMLEDHALHVYVLGGPDFIVGPQAPAAQRNILGVVQKVGLELGKRVIATRRKVRDAMASVCGKAIHPAFGLPGGVSKGVSPEQLPALKALAAEAVDFSELTLKVFKDIVLANKDYLALITSADYTHETCYMGLVDEQGRPNFYDGLVKVVDPKGKELKTFRVQDYLDYVAEHVEPWSYTKFNFFKPLGWKGFVEGEGTSIYSVAPLARLNVATGMATPKAQVAFEEYFKTMGGKPVHQTLANHWARAIEMIYAAERIQELVNDPEITGKDIRTIPRRVPSKGFGVVEAPRGTLFHQYETDERGLITKANLIVATQNNSARIAMSVDKAAKGLIHKGQVSEGLLNMVEMAFRAYDPCHGCATHSLPGQMPLVLTVRDSTGTVVQEIRR
jgi:F420-non-reducing hydrogenase large subunit